MHEYFQRFRTLYIVQYTGHSTTHRTLSLYCTIYTVRCTAPIKGVQFFDSKLICSLYCKIIGLYCNKYTTKIVYFDVRFFFPSPPSPNQPPIYPPPSYLLVHNIFAPLWFVKYTDSLIFVR